VNLIIGAAYIRVSTSEQLEFSPSAQKNAIVMYANKNNISLPENNIFVDEGISGRRADKRPAFMKMIKKAKQKPRPFDVILVHKFDRFARNREDSVVYKSLLKKDCGIKVISITEQLENDKFSIILESMLEAMAEYYSLNLSDEVKKGMSEKARRGEMQTRPPLGYDLLNGKIVINNKEKEIIRLIYNKFVQENMGYVAIARLLNSLGYRTKNNSLFQSKSIKYILENPFYMGIIRWNRRSGKGIIRDEKKWIISNGNHEKIIEKQLFYKAKKRIEILKKNNTVDHSNRYSHYLSGLIKCPYCKGSMVYKTNGKEYNYFRCRKSSEGLCTQTKMIRVDLLEKLVLQKLLTDFNNVVAITKPKTIEWDNKKYIMNKLEKLDKKYNNIKRLYLEDVDTLEEYKANKEILDRERIILNQELEILNKIVNESNMTVNNVLTDNKYSLVEKNKLYKSFINKIEVDVPRKIINIYYFMCPY
jgi:DNA invertase Pin-like site-specific DNA recombinase